MKRGEARSASNVAHRLHTADRQSIHCVIADLVGTPVTPGADVAAAYLTGAAATFSATISNAVFIARRKAT